MVVLSLAMAYAVRYRVFVRSLGSYDTAIQDGFASQEFPLLSRHEIVQLGSAHRPGARPESSYTLVEPGKAPGTFRIGIFGGSFVMGSEAAPGQDFASHLQRIFADMGTRSRNFFVLLNDKTSVDLMRSGSSAAAINSAQTSTEKYTWDRSSFFRAPKNHPSALGYLVHAEETCALLTARRHAVLPDIEILGADGDADAMGPDGGLADFDEVFVSLDGIPAGVFVTSSGARQVAPYSFPANSKDALLDVSGGPSAQFIALDGAIPGSAAWLRFSVDGTPVDVEIGSISLVRGRNVAVLDRPWATKDGAGWRLRASPQGGAISLEMVSDHDITEIRLEIGGAIILEGVLNPSGNPRARRISWQSARGDLLATRGHPEQDATAIAGSHGGDYCITARKGGRPDETWCTRRWRLTDTTIEVGRTGIPAIGG